MNDLTPLSTEDLIRLRDGIRPPQQQQQQQPQAQPEMDLSSISTEDLLKMRDQFAPKVDAGKKKEPDLYWKEAEREYKAELDAGNDPRMTLVRRGFQGATADLAEEGIAAVMTPYEMYKRGTLNPAEAFNYRLAKERYALNRSRDERGLAGHAAEIGGAVAGGLATGGLGIAARGVGLGAKAIQGAKIGGAYGAISGFGSGEGLEDRAWGAAKGAGVGATLGGAIPVVLAGGKAVVGRAAEPIRSYFNPGRSSDRAIGGAMTAAGRSTDDIVADIQKASAQGMSQHTLADALHAPGRELAQTAVSGPPTASTKGFADQLVGRSTGDVQARVGKHLRQDMSVDLTGDQQNALYDTVRKVGYRADKDGLVIGNGFRIDPVRQKAESLLTSPRAELPAVPQDFDAHLIALQQRLPPDRKNLFTNEKKHWTQGYDSLTAMNASIGKAMRDGDTQQVLALKPVRDFLVSELERATPGLKAMNKRYAEISELGGKNSKGENLTGTLYQKGKDATKAGGDSLTDDVVREFDALRAPTTPGMTREELGNALLTERARKHAYRAGVVNEELRRISGNTAKAPDLAGKLNSEEYKRRLLHIAPDETRDRLSDRISREVEWKATYDRALGGSRTQSNLANEADLDGGSNAIAHAAMGNVGSAVKSLLGSAIRGSTGNNVAKRSALADALRMNGATPEAEIRAVLDRISNAGERARVRAEFVRRGLISGAASSSQSDQYSPNRKY